MIIIAGDSHTLALGRPEANNDQVTVSKAENSQLDLGFLIAPWPYEATYYQKAIQLSAEHNLVLSVWGNQHNMHIFSPHTKYDFYLANWPEMEVDPSRELVPETLVRQLFAQSLEMLDHIASQMKAIGSPPIVLAPPPPRRENEKVRKYLITDWHFVNACAALGKTIDDVEIEPEEIRLKTYLVLCDMTREIAEKHGCVYLAPPAEAVDGGFLKEEFWYRDLTHANESYGRLVIKQIEKEVLGR